MYRTLNSETDTEALINSPSSTWLLKHSRTCSISTAALEEFTRYLEANPDQAAGMIVVQDQRPLSNWIAERLKYTHQSPQLFLLRQGRVLWCGSHWGISVAAMKDALNSPMSSSSRPAVAAKPV